VNEPVKKKLKAEPASGKKKGKQTAAVAAAEEEHVEDAADKVPKANGKGHKNGPTNGGEDSTAEEEEEEEQVKKKSSQKKQKAKGKKKMNKKDEAEEEYGAEAEVAEDEEEDAGMDLGALEPFHDPEASEESKHEALYGIIEEVEVVNFMCHKYFKIKFHSHLNFITGPNGSQFSFLPSSFFATVID